MPANRTLGPVRSTPASQRATLLGGYDLGQIRITPNVLVVVPGDDDIAGQIDDLGAHQGGVRLSLLRRNERHIEIIRRWAVQGDGSPVADGQYCELLSLSRRHGLVGRDP